MLAGSIRIVRVGRGQPWHEARRALRLTGLPRGMAQGTRARGERVKPEGLRRWKAPFHRLGKATRAGRSDRVPGIPEGGPGHS